ncbi:uncharacterized protein tacc2 isoform X4 [Cyprinodon tularosa]|uniref:uncharacterized protein tacc2 isoform X4 n=1 Tax=Cyprinodon tularosa TaxID=77115 RepID=UPI0018E257A9|nr:uncharacterized protein tacc2 isoform X4 [Cyprinodon tularosa]
MQFCRKVLCQPCSARVTSPEEDMEYRMGSCIGISHKQTDAESLSGRENQALLTEASTCRPSLLSQSVLPEVPVITGVEEDRGAVSEEDKEELEFPHDLLPSLDFSSELNIWESSLGAHSSSEGRKCEQVNPLLVGLQHNMDVGGSLLVLDGRPDGILPVIPDVQASLQLGPLTPSLTKFSDQELQMAFQECEEQMVSLGMLDSIESDKTQDVVGKATGEVMVNDSGKSFSPLPVAVQPVCGNGGHGNESTHGNIEAANSQMDTVVFSFRDYILGTENNTENIETEMEVEANQCLKRCSELEVGTGMNEQKELLVTNKESPKDLRALETLNKDVCLSSTTEINTSRDSCTEMKEVPGGKVETIASSEKNASDEIDINVCNDDPNSELLYLAPTGAQKETDKQSKDNQSKSNSEKQVGQSKEFKKKKHRKKKKTEKRAEREQKAKAQESEIETQTLSPLDVCTYTDLAAVSTPVSELDTTPLTCGEQTHYEQQLSPGGMLKSSPQSSVENLNITACSLISMQALSQKTHQSDKPDNLDAENSINHNTKCDECVTKEENVINTTPETNQTAVTGHADSSERELDGQMQEAIVTTETKILTEEDQSLFSNSRACVGDSCVDSGLGKALIVVNALPLTTPTLSEVIESKREGESVSCDVQERVATVAVAESEKGAREGKRGGRGEYLGSADVNRDKLLESPCQVSLICSQGSRTLQLSAREGGTAREESCSSKMPHNLAEAEIKGPGEACIRSIEAEFSPAEEKDAEKTMPSLKCCTDHFGSDFQALSVEQLGVTEEGGGGGEVGEKGGFAGKHNLLSQPKGFAGGVSSVKRGASPPSDVAKSQLKSQCCVELIGTIPEGSEEKHFYHKQDDVTVLPLPSYPVQQSNTDAGKKTGLMQELVREEALPFTQPIQPSLVMENNRDHVFQREEQANSDQQVGPRSTEERTAKSTANSQRVSSSPNLTGSVVLLCGTRGGNNRVHFADDVNLKNSSSDTAKEILVQGLDCASLPPLTVHETLYNPVTEASYTFPNFLSFKDPETPTHVATAVDEAVIHCSNIQEQPEEAKFGKGNINEFIDLDHSRHDHHENAVDSEENAKSNATGCTKQILSPTLVKEIGNQVCHLENESKNSGESDSSLNQDFAVTLKEKEESQNASSEDFTCKNVTLPEELFDTDTAPVSEAKADPSICTESKSPETTSQPSCYSDVTPKTGLLFADVMESTRVPLSSSLIPSHLEFLTGCDISFPEHTDSHNANGNTTSVSRKVTMNKGDEINISSLEDDLNHSSISFKTDETPQDLKNGNKLPMSHARSLGSSQVENLTLANQGSAADDELSKEGSDNAIWTCHKEPGSASSEMSDRDDIVCINCPTNETYINIEDNSMGEEKKLNENVTMNNQEEGADTRQQTGKTDLTLQQQNNGVFMETGILQPQYKHNEPKTESTPTEIANKEKRNGSFPSKCKDQSSFLSPSKTSDGFLPPELELSAEALTVYDQDLSQTVPALPECFHIDVAPDPRPTFDHFSMLQEVNIISQEPEQMEQCLRSTHSKEELLGGPAEDKEEACIWTQTVAQQEGDGSVQSLFALEKKDELLDLPGVVREEVPSVFPVDSNLSPAEGMASVYSGKVGVCSQIDEIEQRLYLSKDPGVELNDLDQKIKPNQTTNVGPHSTSEILKHTASVEFATRKLEALPIPLSVSSNVSQNDHGIPSASGAEDVSPNGFNTMQDVFGETETWKEDISAALAIESKQGEIEDTELQSCSISSNTDGSQIVQITQKSSNVEEITKEGEADMVKRMTRGDGQEDNNDEDEGTLLISILNDKGGICSSLSNKLVPQSSTEIHVCSSEGAVSCAKAAEIGDNMMHNTSLDVIIDPSTIAAASNESEEPYDPVAFSEPQDRIEVIPPTTVSQDDAESLEKTPTCSSPVEQAVSGSSDPIQGSQEPEKIWIQAFEDAVSLSEIKQVSTQDSFSPLPSLDSPQVDFLTPSEELASPPRSEDTVPSEEAEEKAALSSCLSAVQRPVNLPQPLEKVIPSEPTKHTANLTTKAEIQEESSEKPKSLESESSQKLLNSEREPVEGAGEQTNIFIPAQVTKGTPEPTRDEVETRERGHVEDLPRNESRAETALQEEELEEPYEKPTKVLPVVTSKVPAGESEVSQTVQDPPTKLQDSGLSLAEQTESSHPAPASPSPPSDDPCTTHLPAIPPHLHKTTESAPHPSLESDTLPSTPPASPCIPTPVPADQCTLSTDNCEDLYPVSAPSQVLLRSSDSDGAFETPESTTPVKAVTPPEPQREQPESDDKGVNGSKGDLTSDLTARDALCHSPSIVFDENKPIAASGTYNFDFFAAEPTSHTLTRSLSLQSGELDCSGLVEGAASGAFRQHSESFSVGTENTSGKLRRPKKVSPGSVKKKPLLRQNSNPDSSKPASSSSTPETTKRTKSRTASPLLTQEDPEVCSATPSPAGTLRRTRKSRVETPPPLLEETIQTCQEQSKGKDPVLPLCQEEAPPVETVADKENSPIPPSASYKWDPDNFENIDPFNTGGSKIANSPVLGRKGPICGPASSPPQSPAVVAEPHCRTATASVEELTTNPEEQPILSKRQPVRLEFDYSEESGEASQQASPPPKKVGKKPPAKMLSRKPKLGLKKAHPVQVEQLDNNTSANHNGSDEIPIPKVSYNIEPDKWEDPNFNPFSSKKSISNSPKSSRHPYTFDPNTDESSNPFKSSNKMACSPPRVSAPLEMSSNDYDNENDNDNIGELEDQNQNKPAKKKRTPLKSNTFRVKRSPKKSPMSDTSQDPTSADESPSLHQQDDHATDEEKLASSTSHKWAAHHDMDQDLNTDHPDFPQPCDVTTFVNENSLPQENPVQDYEIEYMEKIGSSSPPLSIKKPSLYLNLDSVSDSLTQTTNGHVSEPSSPCTGSFEEMEAKISAGMKTPVLSPRPGPEGYAVDKGRKRESEVLSRTQSIEREEQPSSQGPVEALPAAPAQAMPLLLDRLSECEDPLQYLEPDLAETNPTAFAQKLQEELVLAALRLEALQVAQSISQCPSLSTVSPQQRDMLSSAESSIPKSSLYAKKTIGSSYMEGDSPHLPRDLDQSLDIAREEIVSKEKEVLEWQRKYEESRQEVVEMRRIVAEYEKTIAQMIGMPEDDQKEKSLSHHTIQQLIIEKDQALADLNSVEKSLADLFRRYEKMKDVLEGFRKNEEVLKKCAQEYLSRVRKEEQRYQALKIHAEEKLDKANSEIAQVRSKAKQEQAAHQASLRKEQMKVDSLERTLEQKNKEIEELTKICDELIAKMGKS